VFNALAVRNVAKWSRGVLKPPAHARDEWQVFASLTRRLARGLRARIAATVKEWLGPRRMLALALWTGRTGVTLKRLEASVHGIDLGPLKPALPERLKTADSRIAAAPPPLIEDLARLENLLDAELPEGLDLLLIGRRGMRDNNSWMHNLPRLMKGKDRCTLLMHPDDAEARGLTAHTRVLLRSDHGEIEAPLEISDSVVPGVVSLPHGFGHDGRGTRLSVANKTPGVNANALTDSRKVDPVGGTAVLNGVPVFVGAVD
jgi:anaerobic selenocysteine-containing dehydrogenase